MEWEHGIEFKLTGVPRLFSRLSAGGYNCPPGWTGAD